MDVTGRVGRLQPLLADAGCDALLVTKLVNVRYLTGFSGSAGQVLVIGDELVLVTDGRYEEQAAEELDQAGVAAKLHIVSTASGQYQIIDGTAAGLRLGFESQAVSYALHQAMVATYLPSVGELVPTSGLVEGLRVVKDDGEVARIEAASAVASAALAAISPMLFERPTENDVGLALDAEIRRRGAEGNSFETIVGSGPNGAKPHHRAAGSRRTIDACDLVVFDFGAMVDGYCSDMTRTACIGSPTDTQRRMLDVVTESQAAGVGEVRAGAETTAVDAACRDIIAAAGWREAFSHGTGHGVGLEIHEDPRVSWSGAATLAAGHVVTVEPGVYLPEHGGVRIEDTVVVTADGSRPLTHFTKEPDLHAWPSPPTT
jgi:Xaa-Pro aminopeptidase